MAVLKLINAVLHDSITRPFPNCLLHVILGSVMVP